MSTLNTTPESALVLRLTGSESAENAEALARTLRSARIEPRVVSYWPDREEAKARGVGSDEVLLSGGIDSAERLSAFQFRRRFGLELDLIDAAAHLIASGGVRTDEILTESPWNQHLRGVGAAVSELLDGLNPDVVFVPHGAEVVSRIVSAIVAHRGIRHLFWESPFFPGYHFVDPKAPHFFRGACRIDLTHATTSPTHSELSRTAAYVSKWQAERLSKYGQETPGKLAARLGNWVARSDRKVLFIPGQVTSDANVVVGLGEHTDLQSIYRLVLEELPEGWRAIFKPHPKSPSPSDVRDFPEGVFWAEGVSIHDLFLVADAVAVHSSNVGLEALMAGLPVLTWGNPVYGGKGVTTDLPDPRDLRTTLMSDALSLPDPDAVRRLVHHILNEGLVQEGDGDTLRARIAEARTTRSPARLSWYGRPVQALAESARALDGQLQRNKPMAQALESMREPARANLGDKLEERLLAHAFGGPVSVDRLPGFRGPRADLEAALTGALGLEVIECFQELQNSVNPELAFREMAQSVNARTAVAFSAFAPATKEDAIQCIGADDVAYLAAGQEPLVQADTFGLDGTQLTAAIGEAPLMLVLLRDPSLPRLSAAQRSNILNTRFAFRPCSVPPDLFLYSGSVEHQQDVGLARIDLGKRTRHVVFGPMIPLPTGRWEAAFQIEFERFPRLLNRLLRRKRVVTLEVNEVHAGVLARETITTETESNAVVLQFSTRSDALYEFRVLAHSGKENAVIRFGGVGITEATG